MRKINEIIIHCTATRKYYASVMNIRDFLAENIGNEFVGIVAKSIDDNYRRNNH